MATKMELILLMHNDLMPMSCDILKIENFLKPLKIIVVDGRAIVIADS